MASYYNIIFVKTGAVFLLRDVKQSVTIGSKHFFFQRCLNLNAFFRWLCRAWVLSAWIWIFLNLERVTAGWWWFRYWALWPFCVKVSAVLAIVCMRICVWDREMVWINVFFVCFSMCQGDEHLTTPHWVVKKELKTEKNKTFKLVVVIFWSCLMYVR